MLRRASAPASRRPRGLLRSPRSCLTALPAGLAALLPLLAAGAASAKQGMVTTKDHPPHSYIGDVSETTTPGKVDVNTADLGKVTIDARQVEKVTFFNTPKEELDARWLALERRDVKGRVALAQFAYDNKMYDQAHDVVASALQIEPTNRQALDLQKQVNEQLLLAHPPPPPPPAAAQAEAAGPPGRRPGQAPAHPRGGQPPPPDRVADHR